MDEFYINNEEGESLSKQGSPFLFCPSLRIGEKSKKCANIKSDA